MVEFVKDVGWCARASWQDSAGKRHRKYKRGFRLKREAEAWEKDYAEKHSNKPMDAETMTVSRLLDAYISVCEAAGRSTNTITGYHACEKRINRFLGDVPVSKLSKIVIETAYANMAKERINDKPVKISTIAYSHRVLKAACNYAIDSDIITKNPCYKAKLPQETRPFQAQTIQQTDAALMLQEIHEFDEQLYLVTLLCLIYGMRRGEALGLRWIDVDFDNDVIEINGQYTYGKDKKPEWTELLKTQTSHRKVFMVPYVRDVLSEVYNAFPKNRIAKYVCELDGALPSPTAITKRWDSFRKKNGYDGVRLHDLRHSSAMMMIQNGADLNTVKQTLGHSKIQTTERYLHSDFTASAAVSQRVASGIFGTKEVSKKTEKSGG